MSFEARDNIIRVTDTNGDVVFDTGTPMPHIAAVVTHTVTHAFLESGDTPVALDSGFVSAFMSGCRDFQCNFEYVCKDVYTCGFEQRCSLQYVCEYDFSQGQNVCGFQNVCENVYVCGFDEQCGFENVCDWVDVEGYYTSSGNRVSALEHSQTYTIGTLTAGTNPDFLLALMTASRTVVGSQSDFGAFISAIPNGKKIAANGSTVLESAFIPGGAPWLSRIVSVFLDGDAVKAEFKHSNRQYTSVRATDYTESCFGFPSAWAPADNTSSTWQITFEVYAGKFTT
jgi:hypothetical protein